MPAELSPKHVKMKRENHTRTHVHTHMCIPHTQTKFKFKKNSLIIVKHVSSLNFLLKNYEN